MELLQLRYFYESAQSESFARTAEKHMVPATSVSASIKRLEQELGLPLFHRRSNRIVLNDNGRKLLRSLKIVFSELDQAVDGLTASAADQREIRLLVRACRSEITNRIIEYKQDHPQISFRTVFDFDVEDFDDFDLIIDEENDRYPDFVQLPLATLDLQLQVAKNSPLLEKKWQLRQLADQPFISIGENNGLHKILIRACKRAGFSPNIVVQANDILCRQRCIENGVGIGIGRSLHRSLFSITKLDVTDFKERQTLCLYYRPHAAYGNIEHFIRFIRNRGIY